MPLSSPTGSSRSLVPRRGRLKRLVKVLLGRALLVLRPDIARRFETGGVDGCCSRSRDTSFGERLVLAVLIARRAAPGAQSEIADAHRKFWSSAKAVEHHGASAEHSFRTAFLGPHFPMVEALQRELSSGEYHTLCEIGCGSGQVINFMAQRLPELRAFIGLDLSEVQVALNTRHYDDPRLRFVAADATTWIPEHAVGGFAFLTYGGVLEYFPEPVLKAVLRTLAARPPICFALVEPIASDYDLENEVQSRLFGGEMSFSHHYLRAFSEAGFRIRWQKELVPGRWLMMVASLGGEP